MMKEQFAAVKEMLLARCLGCYAEKNWPANVEAAPEHAPSHTCPRDIELVQEYGVELWQQAYGLAHGQGGTQQDWDELRAEIMALTEA